MPPSEQVNKILLEVKNIINKYDALELSDTVARNVSWHKETMKNCLSGLHQYWTTHNSMTQNFYPLVCVWQK